MKVAFMNTGYLQDDEEITCMFYNDNDRPIDQTRGKILRDFFIYEFGYPTLPCYQFGCPERIRRHLNCKEQVMFST